MASAVRTEGLTKRYRETLALDALDLELSAADVAEIEGVVTPSSVAGTRYDEHQMRMLDSER